MQISLPRRLVFKTISPQDEERERRKLLAEYSWRLPRGIFRFFISASVAFFIAAVSLFAWNGESPQPTVDFFTTEGNATIGLGENVRAFSFRERLSSGMTLSTDKAERFSLLLFGKNIVRLDRDTKVVISSFSADSRDSVFLDLDLQQGNLWINTTMSGNTVRVKTGSLVLSVANAAMAVRREAGSISVYTDRHAVSSMLGSTQFLVPSGMEFTIRESEMTGKIEELRYSKFKKEFFRLLSESTISGDEWMTFNRQKDTIARNWARTFLTERISAQKFFTFKEASTLGILQKYYYQWGGFFIVNKDEEQEFQVDRYLAPFHKAEKFFQSGDKQNGAVSLQIFLENLALVQDRDAVSSAIGGLMAEYEVVLPDDALYPLKTALRSALFSLALPEGKDAQTLSALRERLYEVFDLVFYGNNTEAKRSFATYKNDFLYVLRTFSESFASLQSHFSFEYELWYQLLSEHTFFFDAHSFEIFSPLESALIASVSDEIGRNETRLTFVNNKLHLLEKLSYLFKGNAISRAKALPLVQMLLTEGNALLSDAKAYDVAVFNLFSAKFSSFSQLFRFFESRDFDIVYDSVYSEESFREFQETEKYLAELQEYLKKVSGEKPSRVQRVNVDEFLLRVRSDFSEYGITVRDVEPLEELNYRLFSIGTGSVGGTTFRANYDREYQLVYDMVIDSSEIAVSGIHLRNVTSFVEGLEKSPPEVSGIREEQEIVKSRSQEEEDFIRISLQSLEQAGVVVNTDDVVILNFDAKRFWIGRASYEDVEGLVFSFEFDQQKGSVSKISVETSMGSKEIAGTYAVGNLRGAVEGVEGLRS